VSKLAWIAIAVGLAVALLAFTTRRPRNAPRRAQLDKVASQDDPQDRVAAAIRAGRKIEAIKLLRESTGLGLAEAKAAVERMQDSASRHHAPESAAPARTNTDPRSIGGVQDALARDDLIKAIKLYREHTGVSLKEAKQAIDELRAGR
jgi:ribosomal protein L7/L12